MSFKEVCQSCLMPLNEGVYGTEKDQSKNKDYCIYCYKDGKFEVECSMEEMIEHCIPFGVKATGKSEEEMRKMYQEYYPKLKRWAKSS